MEILNINGIRVLYHPNNSFLTSIQILTNAGSSVEAPDHFGMAHILEHMFFKGSKKRPLGTDISRAANDIGGKMNAYTSYDHTAYYITVLNESFNEGFDILADMYVNPSFPEKEFKKEINPILSEYREREDDPENYLHERALQEYLGDSYHPIIGTEESIRSATVEKMHRFKELYYGGQNTMISIVGGIDKKQMIRAIESHFTESKETALPSHKKATCKSGNLTLTRKEIHEAYFAMMYPALAPTDPGKYKEEMMGYILGGDDSSLLFESIREEKGMSTYGVYSFSMRHDPFSVMGISGGIDPEELEMLQEEVQKQIHRIKTGDFEEHRLKRAKASIRTSIAARSETSRGIASLINIPVLKGETENPIEKSLREVENTTINDIVEAANRVFNGPEFNAVLLPEDE